MNPNPPIKSNEGLTEPQQPLRQRLVQQGKETLVYMLLVTLAYVAGGLWLFGEMQPLCSAEPWSKLQVIYAKLIGGLPEWSLLLMSAFWLSSIFVYLCYLFKLQDWSRRIIFVSSVLLLLPFDSYRDVFMMNANALGLFLATAAAFRLQRITTLHRGALIAAIANLTFAWSLSANALWYFIALCTTLIVLLYLEKSDNRLERVFVYKNLLCFPLIAILIELVNGELLSSAVAASMVPSPSLGMELASPIYLTLALALLILLLTRRAWKAALLSLPLLALPPILLATPLFQNQIMELRALILPLMALLIALPASKLLHGRAATITAVSLTLLIALKLSYIALSLESSL